MAGDDNGEDQLKAVYFAAGMAAFMACIERAVVVSVFMHWRVWAFLALNLLLLAILFTSKSQTQPIDVDQEDCAEFERMKTSPENSSPQVSTHVGGEVEKLQESGDGAEKERKKDEEDGRKKEDDDVLSNEELNQRVEAFIAMFRQHLVSDAKE